MSQKNENLIPCQEGFIISKISSSASKPRETTNNPSQSQPQKQPQPTNSSTPKK